MNIRTDLALERMEVLTGAVPQGVTREELEEGGVKITRIRVEGEQGAAALQKPPGTYVTLDLRPFQTVTGRLEEEVEAAANQIRPFLPDNPFLPDKGLVLCVGLGNADITPDTIGPMTTASVLATRHIMGEIAASAGLEGLRPVAALAPGVLGQTGMETAEVIYAVCRELSPAAVIAVDALASRSVERLGCTVQIADTGICPGSGVQNARKALTRESLGVPVIAVGVPTVVDMATIAYDLAEGSVDASMISHRGRTMMVTPREIDVIVEQASKLLAFSINRALQPQLSFEELSSLVS